MIGENRRRSLGSMLVTSAYIRQRLPFVESLQMSLPRLAIVLVGGWLAVAPAAAHAASLAGIIVDGAGGALPGASVTLTVAGRASGSTTTDLRGHYGFEGIAEGRYEVTAALANFAPARREVVVNGRDIRVDLILHLSLSADVTVTGKESFTNLADVDDPSASLVGVAQSASQGAITAKQLDARPLMRSGEVLESVPGVVISQHSGEGKANQYYLRGFNLDHGTDFATTVAGMPVNMPTHAHGHGYSDLNFLIPEIVSGVQFSKGPYFADQGDFATAGAANINYTNALARPIVRIGGGEEGFARVVVAASPDIGAGRLLAAVEMQHNDGPWIHPDNYRKVNGVLRYSQGDTVNGLSITGMAYRGTWNATDQVPARAVAEGTIGRFGSLDSTGGGDTSRYSGSFEWQRTRGAAATKVTAYGMGYDLSLFSNFTYFLDDPVHGDQFHQGDRRFVSGAKATHRRLERWAGHSVQNTIGVQLRSDDITALDLTHTQARRPIETVRRDAVFQTSGALFAQNEFDWAPWLRTLAGIRADGYRFRVDASESVNGGTARAGLVSPKGGVVLGPFRRTEFYANAGLGFHSNDARGATITVDPATGQPVDRVTPLARARGAEVGVRTVSIPHLQTSVAVWRLSLASELTFAGDAGTTEAGRPSLREGVELSNYYRPLQWLTFDGDVSVSRARFTDVDPVGYFIPGSIERVIAAGVAVNQRHMFGSVRLRYMGPRPLIENNSVRSEASTLLNLEAGRRLARNVKLGLDVFNVLNAADSDIDYYYRSRLPGEPVDGVSDIHFHPTLPRTARINLLVGF